MKLKVYIGKERGKKEKRINQDKTKQDQKVMGDKNRGRARRKGLVETRQKRKGREK